jgi:hypothetical protein
MIKPLTLTNKIEIRNDGSLWAACKLPPGVDVAAGDTVTFYPSVDAVVANLDVKVVSYTGTRQVACAPVVLRMNVGAITVLLHNRNGGVARLDAGYCVGDLHIARDVPDAIAAQPKRKVG